LALGRAAALEHRFGRLH